jgi:hypothetical protein
MTFVRDQGESYAGLYIPYISAGMLDQKDKTYFDLSGALMYVNLMRERPTRDTWQPQGVSHKPNRPFSRNRPCPRHLLTCILICLGTTLVSATAVPSKITSQRINSQSITKLSSILISLLSTKVSERMGERVSRAT